MTERSHHSTILAALWMTGWLAAMVTIAVAAREAGKVLHVFQIMEIRSLLGIVMFLPMIATAGGLRAMRTGHFGLHFSRNAVHYGAQFLWFFAITMIPIAEVVAIEFTGPVWVALLAVVFLGERMTATRVASVVLGVVGVLIVVRPGLDHVDVGQVVALVAAIGFAGSIILVKSLTRTESVVSIIFWMLIIQSVIGAIPAAMLWQTPPLTVWPWLGSDRLLWHLFPFLHDARAASCGCNDCGAARFPSRPAYSTRRLARLRRAFRPVHHRRRRSHPWRKSAQPKADCTERCACRMQSHALKV